ncbi:hypothetical protein PNEG_01908 [Pneumocystis murina B123]|uniref:Proteasome subunit beta n=1 Tax=Pneumocystis murina (strain B123) TaxID=1069680 RepID=M7NM30_PNEMU|nr:hypothetical protein PNEG_01908 [Pneumocystis murina B123]EMR09723.1 hypothetical protein PNEG_01908 [Pneumocystis murina B123]
MEKILKSFSKDEIETYDSKESVYKKRIPYNILKEKYLSVSEVTSKITHGTTTLSFRFSEGIIVAVDSRATAGSWIASQTVHKVIHINNHLLGTMAGGAADCQFWETVLSMECRLYELRNKTQISAEVSSKILANILYSYKGMGLSVGTMICGLDSKRGTSIFYLDSEGTRLKGNLFCVGSGQTFAYSILDAEYHWNLQKDQAIYLAKRAILASTHRDSYSGGFINIYYINADGYEFCGGFDVGKLFYDTIKTDNSFQHVIQASTS